MAAYVRKKKVKNREYFQLVENRRIDGNPRQKVVMHLGRHSTIDEALENWPKEVKRLRTLATRNLRNVETRLDDASAETQPARIRAKIKQANGMREEADKLEAKLKSLRELRASDMA